MPKLFIAEEQGLLRHVYETFFSASTEFDVTGVSSHAGAEAVTRAVNAFRPEVMIIGTKVVRGGLMEALARVRADRPEVTPVLLASSYDLTGAQGVLDQLQHGAAGFAFLLKDTVDSVEDLARVAHVAAAGHVVVDPGLMQDLINVLNAYSGFFKVLTARDIEVLDLMAKGLSDAAIAEASGLPEAAVERQIEAIYEKTGAHAAEQRDPRVYTITLYLKAVGALPVREFRSAESELPDIEFEASPTDHVSTFTPAANSSAPVLGDEASAPYQAWDLPEQEAAPREVEASAVRRDLEETPRVQNTPVGMGQAASTLPHSGETHAPDYAPDHWRRGDTPGEAVWGVAGEGAAYPTPDYPVLDNAVARYGREVLHEFQQFTRSGRPADVETAAALLEWAAQRNLKVRWGGGRLEGSFAVSLEIGGIAFWLLTVWAIGAVEVQFQMLEAQQPFSAESLRAELARRLEHIQGVRIPSEALTGRPRVSLSSIRHQEDLAHFISTMEWAVDTINHAWAAKG
ncbi:MAG: response regulator transcription factor [Dehalococcoidia bacterium]